ncbi:phosphopantetheine-binding protein [Streptomyces sp. PSRA5]|uniref:phosphopantetheine-binding protein n=1 Tax=Streptomyces panacea TaxID=3035064 RepID=UPI00339CFB7E
MLAFITGSRPPSPGDLGGDSFKVLRVVETLRERLRADIPLAALLLEPTAADFSEELRRIMAHGPAD